MDASTLGRNLCRYEHRKSQKSTAEKGKRYVEVVVGKITELLVELAQLP
ncbi:MAG: hypothetical protein ACOYEG_05000 [Petrimonas sp.]